MRLFGIFGKHKEENKKEASPVVALDHKQEGPWHQYDVLTDTVYGWQTILDWADYMIKTDIADVQYVTACASPNGEEIDYSLEYAFHEGVKKVPQFAREQALLGVAGHSRSLHIPMKIVWLTNTKVIRFFIMTDDEKMIREYAAKTIKRSFDAPTEEPKPSRVQEMIKKSAEEFEALRADASKYIPYLRDLWESKFTEEDKEAVMELIHAGNITEAIKQCHLRTKIGLMQAKDLVEKILTKE